MMTAARLSIQLYNIIIWFLFSFVFDSLFGHEIQTLPAQLLVQSNSCIVCMRGKREKSFNVCMRIGQ